MKADLDLTKGTDLERTGTEVKKEAGANPKEETTKVRVHRANVATENKMKADLDLTKGTDLERTGTEVKKEAGANPKEKTTKVRVHRANVATENKNMIISVTVNESSSRKRFQPGEEVALTDLQINGLRSAVEENQLPLPADSGIYLAADPLALARKSYPGMNAMRDSVTGGIIMTSRIPNYIIETL